MLFQVTHSTQVSSLLLGGQSSWAYLEGGREVEGWLVDALASALSKARVGIFLTEVVGLICEIQLPLVSE